MNPRSRTPGGSGRKCHYVARPRTAQPEVRKSDLSPAWRELIDTCFRVWVGSVHDLAFVNGEPAFTAGTTAARTIKLSWEDPPAAPPETEDYAVRREVLELVALAKRLGGGVIERLDVVSGLPRAIQLRGPVAEVVRV